MSLWDGIKVVWSSWWAKRNSSQTEPLPPPRSFVDGKLEDTPVFRDLYRERNDTPGGRDLHDKVHQAVSNIKAGVR